jgi:hypothetical protein
MIISLQIKIYRAIIKEMSGPLAKWKYIFNLGYNQNRKH